jgi:hypothetical protein
MRYGVAAWRIVVGTAAVNENTTALRQHNTDGKTQAKRTNPADMPRSCVRRTPLIAPHWSAKKKKKKKKKKRGNTKIEKNGDTDTIERKRKAKNNKKHTQTSHLQPTCVQVVIVPRRADDVVTPVRIQHVRR